MRAQSDARAALPVGLLAAVVFVVLAILVGASAGARDRAAGEGPPLVTRANKFVDR